MTRPRLTSSRRDRISSCSVVSWATIASASALSFFGFHGGWSRCSSARAAGSMVRLVMAQILEEGAEAGGAVGEVAGVAADRGIELDLILVGVGDGPLQAGECALEGLQV